MAAANADKLTYEVVEGWGKLPEGWTVTQVAGVAVDSQDNIIITKAVPAIATQIAIAIPIIA